MKLKTLALATIAGVASFSATAATTYDLSVSNTAKLSYTISGKETTDESTISFEVDRKVIFTLSGTPNDADINAGDTGHSVFTLKNDSNAPIGFKLNIPTDTNVAYYIDSDHDGVLDVNTDTLVDINTPAIQLFQDTGANVATVDPEEIIIFVEVISPGDAANNAAYNYSLVATAVEPTTATLTAAFPTDTPAAIGTVGAEIVAVDSTTAWTKDAVQTVVDTAITNPTKRNQDGTYTVRAANLVLAKTVEITYDPINKLDNPKAIPGATVKYTLTLTNTGAVDATVALTDPLNESFDSDLTVASIEVDGIAYTTYTAATATIATGDILTIPEVTVPGLTAAYKAIPGNETATEVVVVVTFEVVLL